MVPKGDIFFTQLACFPVVLVLEVIGIRGEHRCGSVSEHKDLMSSAGFPITHTVYIYIYRSNAADVEV